MGLDIPKNKPSNVSSIRGSAAASSTLEPTRSYGGSGVDWRAMSSFLSWTERTFLSWTSCRKIDRTNDFDVELSFAIDGVATTAAIMVVLLGIFRDQTIKPSYVLNIAWAIVTNFSSYHFKKQPDRTLARSNHCIVCVVSATVLAILTGLPFTKMYEPILPICLPLLWVIWTVCLCRYCTDDLHSRMVTRFGWPNIRNTNIIDILYLYFGLVLGCIDADLCK